MSAHENGGERKTSTFSRNGNGGREVTIPLSALVAVVLAVLGAGGGAGALLRPHDEIKEVVEALHAVVEGVSKIERKLDVITVRLDSFEPRLVIVEAEARRNSDRITRLEEREAAGRAQPPR